MTTLKDEIQEKKRKEEQFTAQRALETKLCKTIFISLTNDLLPTKKVAILCEDDKFMVALFEQFFKRLNIICKYSEGKLQAGEFAIYLFKSGDEIFPPQDAMVFMG